MTINNNAVIASIPAETPAWAIMLRTAIRSTHAKRARGQSNTTPSRKPNAPGAQIAATQTFKAADVPSTATREAVAARYPAGFVPSAFRNPQTLIDEAGILAWLDSFDLLRSTKMRERMARLGNNLFGNFIVPTATAEHAVAMGKFFAIFVLMDDQFVEPFAVQQSFTVDPELVFDTICEAVAVAGQMPFAEFAARHSELVAAVIDYDGCTLGQYAQACMSLTEDYVAMGAPSSWCVRLAGVVREYFRYGGREAKTVAELQRQFGEQRGELTVAHDPRDPLDAGVDTPTSGPLAGDALIEYIFAQRIRCIFVPVIAVLVEQASGYTPAAEGPSKAVQEFIHVSAFPCFLVNDFFGLARDLAGDEHCFNDMYLTGYVNGWTLAESIGFAQTLHDSCVEYMDAFARGSGCATTAERRYAQFMCIMARGYAQWHNHSERYKTVVAVEQDVAYGFTVIETNHSASVSPASKPISPVTSPRANFWSTAAAVRRFDGSPTTTAAFGYFLPCPPAFSLCAPPRR